MAQFLSILCCQISKCSVCTRTRKTTKLNTKTNGITRRYLFYGATLIFRNGLFLFSIGSLLKSSLTTFHTAVTKFSAVFLFCTFEKRVFFSFSLNAFRVYNQVKHIEISLFAIFLLSSFHYKFFEIFFNKIEKLAKCE